MALRRTWKPALAGSPRAEGGMRSARRSWNAGSCRCGSGVGSAVSRERFRASRRPVVRLMSSGGRADDMPPEKVWPKPLNTRAKGIDILHNPLWNKGLAYNYEERDRLNLRGLIPPLVRDIDDQERRAIAKIRAEPDPVRANLYLQSLHNRNETLYHKLVVDYIAEIAPLIYTPTVGTVCEQFGVQFRRARGMFFSRHDVGHMASMVYNWPHERVDVIVVTDGSRILGLGDLGVHGMGIPIGKLALYCAAGGIAPHRVLPVMLDVGTNNKKFLDDPDYIGTRYPRLEGREYFEFVDEFMQAATGRWKDVVIQFEDFETSKAVPLLNRYRHKYRCFNDDIQGTGCVTLAGILSASQTAGSHIKETKVMCVGAGSAGLGVCTAIKEGMVAAGLSEEAARERFVLCNHNGALGRKDGKHGDPNHASGFGDDPDLGPWMSDAVSDGASLLETMETFRPTCLLGLAGQPSGLFTEDLIKLMTANCDMLNQRPIIMPMSNPTAKAECTPRQAYEWSDGQAIVATGSPFEPVELNGKVYIPSQCNNMYVFPGIGLAASVAGMKTITDRMLYRAAQACVASMTEDEIADGRSFPAIERIREVSLNVAVAVIDEGFQQNLCTKLKARDLMGKGSLKALVKSKMYSPYYVPLVDPN